MAKTRSATKEKEQEKEKNPASLLNFIWFLLFCSCVAGLAMWTMGAGKPGAKEAPSKAEVGAPIAETGMALIPGGRFRMGNDRSDYASERPAHEVDVAPFLLDRHEVTNRQFAKFIGATRHKTTAEKDAWAPVFDHKKKEWVDVEGADWQHPGGPQTTIAGGDDLPVVQVSWHDAQAYAAWAGKRLPTEAEWEFAARSGLKNADFPWGSELTPAGKCLANCWQGTFPDKDLATDGFTGPAPAGSFPPNAYGVYDLSGNVWEWCHDWFSDDYYRHSPSDHPPGPAAGLERVQRGGSFLCSENHSSGYRVFSRMSSDPSKPYPHCGFRCAKNAP